MGKRKSFACFPLPCEDSNEYNFLYCRWGAVAIEPEIPGMLGLYASPAASASSERHLGTHHKKFLKYRYL